jgi:DNA polymerase-1
MHVQARSGYGVTPVDKRLLLVDGHSLANRAFYALPPLTASDGTPTGAVFGFFSMLFRFLSEKRPSHIAIAFDLPGPTFRHVEYAEYKAQRKPPPPELSAQIPILKEALDVLRLPRVEMEGYEADDIIGTLASKWKQCGGSVTILSGDRDCLQLVDDEVAAILPVKGISQVKEYNPQSVREDLGVGPDQVRDYKALRGDVSDNIPGVKGIGEKTATALLQQFGTLEGVYERIEDVTPARVKNLLVAGKDMAFLSRALATIDMSVPLDPCDLEDELAWRPPDLGQVKALFAKMELHTLVPRFSALVADVLGKGSPAEKAHPEGSRDAHQMDLESTVSPAHRQATLGITEPEPVQQAKSRVPTGVGEGPETLLPQLDAGHFRAEDALVIDDEARLKAFAEDVRSTGMLGVYAIVEEITRDFGYPPVIGVSSGRSFGAIKVTKAGAAQAGVTEPGAAAGVTEPGAAAGVTEPGAAAGVTEPGAAAGVTEPGAAAGVTVPGAAAGVAEAPVQPGGQTVTSLPRGVTEETLWQYLSPLLVATEIAKVGFDLKWALTLCFKRGITLRGKLFDVLIAAYLLDPTRTNYRLEDLVRKYSGMEMPEAPRDREEASQRNALMAHLSVGAHACLPIADSCRADLEHAGLASLAYDVEFPLIEVLAAMEATGIKPDLALGASIRESFADALRVLEDSIYGMAGEKFNLGSPKQLSHVLFERLGLEPTKKTKTGWSTDAEVLEALSLQHELPAKILEYRQYAKLKSTYLDVLEEVTNPTTGRIHSTFHQTVTATGRLSSSEPNLQNIPVRGDLGRSLRRIFIPEEGWLFLASDYSQIELRIMAHMAGDPTMIDAFGRGEDIHTRTASEIFGVPVDKVDYDLRSKAKAVNFGIIYGISEFGLARNTGVTMGEARMFIESYFARYPKVREFMDRSIETARQYGYVTTILGRRRAIPEINSRIRARRGFAERTAINTPIQGSAADIIKLAMVRIFERLKKEGLSSRLILQVHDELIFEIPPEEESLMRELVRSEMEGVVSLKVPLQVEIDVGKSWYEV